MLAIKQTINRDKFDVHLIILEAFIMPYTIPSKYLIIQREFKAL
ncbi:protein of unknown function [Shewanella benthica]|uniref:Uncharacterized protein n=1 Tax=Shewanella benthica TaxID=43661 RepID=A0A330LVD5_9GAMM|nr:protein of unknown function [Shewanella benthica]